MFRRPFVYLSEAVITPTKSPSIISAAARSHNGSPVIPVQDLWTQAALSVKRQAALYRHTGYKGEAWHHWLADTVDLVADGIHFDTNTSRSAFKTDLASALGKPSAYYVPDETRQFLDQLEDRAIGWGIIANENHRYQAILKFLNLSPTGPIVSAGGPALFKPLPSIWKRAVQRAPAASKHDIWFIGSVLHPCDNMVQSELMRCALLAPGLAQSDPVSQHFRVSSLADLEGPLLGTIPGPSIPDFTTIEEPQHVGERDGVLRTTHIPLLSRDVQEVSLASLNPKTTKGTK